MAQGTGRPSEMASEFHGVNKAQGEKRIEEREKRTPVKQAMPELNRFTPQLNRSTHLTPIK